MHFANSKYDSSAPKMYFGKCILGSQKKPSKYKIHFLNPSKYKIQNVFKIQYFKYMYFQNTCILPIYADGRLRSDGWTASRPPSGWLPIYEQNAKTFLFIPKFSYVHNSKLDLNHPNYYDFSIGIDIAKLILKINVKNLYYLSINSRD